jgi:hypothetical protein
MLAGFPTHIHWAIIGIRECIARDKGTKGSNLWPYGSNRQDNCLHHSSPGEPDSCSHVIYKG